LQHSLREDEAICSSALFALGYTLVFDQPFENGRYLRHFDGEDRLEIVSKTRVIASEDEIKQQLVVMNPSGIVAFSAFLPTLPAV